MSRSDRILFGLLGAAALLLGVNTLVAAGAWIGIWQAFNDFGLSLTTIHVTDDRTSIDVGFSLRNLSRSDIGVNSITTTVLANGHTVAAGRQDMPGVTLSAGARRDTTVSAEVYQIYRTSLENELRSGRVRWNVSGQVEVTVPGARVTAQVPYSGTLTQP